MTRHESCPSRVTRAPRCRCPLSRRRTGARHSGDMIVDRHQANGMLFNAFLEKPEALLSYLGETYHEIRNEGTA